ncbi:MAG: hypothetical protein JSU70_17780 [Phycisphaerales bacterium]|nr:MAG: hypothetical protein JSU70_17780 [Phycisphaerales bacterium]
MCRKLIHPICIVLLLGLSSAAQAELFTDDFDTPHDYINDGVAGTMWDDFFGLLQGETVDALNASGDRPGQLYMASTNGAWAEPWTSLGPFLFKVVEGDFIATVTISDYAGTADAWVMHNNCGILARAYRDDAGEGEDWVAIDYFPIWGCGNFVRTANDDSRFENCHNGKAFDLDPYLQLERKGNVFHFRTSADGSSWTEMICSPVTRDDFEGLPLMVGLYHATYSGNQGYVGFDDFSLEAVVQLKAYDPDPADGADNVTIPYLRWTAGQTAAHHDVYFGTDPDAPEYMARQPRVQANYYHAPGFTPGTTYYWRVDEVEEDGDIHEGDLWSFTAAALTAGGPSPADGAECVSTDADLSWSAGSTASEHEVYFGTSETAVAGATTASTEFKGSQPLLQTTHEPGNLTSDTTYYWRVDEVEAGGTVRHKGKVWSFTTLADIPISDPNLVGWWKFDGVCGGAIAIDSSGYGHHGTIIGDPLWIEGYERGALEFDGRDDYVELPIGSVIGSLTNSTFMTWVDSQPGGPWQRIFDFGNDPNSYMCLIPRIWFMDPMRFAITTEGGGGEIQADAPAAIESGWHHVAVTISADDRTAQVYLDGVVVATNTAVTLTPSDLGNTTNNWLGRSQYDADAYYIGSMDDFRIYDYTLSQGEIERAMVGDPSLAHSPHPLNGSTLDIERAVPLSWLPGDKAAEHGVYLGTDEEAVAGADASDTTGIYRGRQGPASYLPPETLQWGGTYYWRIDEYNNDGTTSEGRIWSFTVADYLTVDDFEDYNDFSPDRIFQTWLDGWGYTDPPPGNTGNGSGSTVGYTSPPFAEQTIVHGGGQSMPFEYDNTGTEGKFLYSETEREWAVPQDMTRKGVAALTLWFYGDAANSAGRLYVALQDSVGQVRAVPHDDPEVLRGGYWQEWSIDLRAFGNVNVSSITKMYIGVGNKTAPQVGGTGTLFFDDVRLYPPRCVASIAKPDADLSENCVVDYDDVVILAGQWLDTGLTVTPVDAGTGNLVGHWKLDDGSGIDAADSSGNGNHGTLRDNPEWVAGHDGGALRFDGTDDYLELPIGSLIGSLTNSTFATWANFSNAGGGWQRIFDFGSDTVMYMFLTPRMGAAGEMRFAITIEGGGAPEQMVTAPGTLPSGWHHVAVTINADNDTITLYQDGLAVAENTEATLSPSDLGNTTNNWLGRSQYVADAYYVGLIDDFRIYSRALARGEVAWLAGRTELFSEPVDLNVDGEIDLKDFAELADSWLDELLWPRP